MWGWGLENLPDPEGVAYIQARRDMCIDYRPLFFKMHCLKGAKSRLFLAARGRYVWAEGEFEAMNKIRGAALALGK